MGNDEELLKYKWVCSLYGAEKSLSEIAQETGYNKNYIRAVISAKRAGIPFSKGMFTRLQKQDETTIPPCSQSPPIRWPF